jgi:peptide/nickel transport system substrate-binding protein
LKAQLAPSATKTARVVLHGDLKIFDPIWTTANMTGNHGLLIYDTLFVLDDDRNVKPQMVDKWGVSDDKKTYTFTLRDGLKFHDGQTVTSADVVASIRRWSARDGAAQHLFKRVADTPVRDDKTFQIVLKEPYGPVLEALGKIETNLPVIMRKKDAKTDPNEQVTTKVGSGPSCSTKARQSPDSATSMTGTRAMPLAMSRRPAWPAARSPSSIVSSSRTWPMTRLRLRH